MKKLMLSILALALSGIALFAQDITGSWQGTLSPPNGKPLRIVMKVSKDPSGALKAMMYSIDQGAQGIPGTITVQGPNVKILTPGIGGTYEGKLANTDGNAITGTWTQGPTPAPLNLTLATAATAWVIPEPPPPPTPMAANADPSFEVATIKPSVPDSPGKGIRVRGREFSTLNTTLSDLITFAYGLHPRQITNAPAWMESDKFDLLAKPDGTGQPNDAQWKTMIKKLLADRFQLKFHNEKKELSVFALTIGKTGSKLTPSTGDPKGLPGLGFRGLGNLVVRNANMADFSNLMQSAVLDRPVVDQTGITGRFDFSLLWMPDETQFANLKMPPPPDGDTRANLFTAMQEQLGLKLEATKAPVDVLAIDRVQKPSDN